MADALRETLAESAADAPRPRRAPRRRLFRKYAAFFVAVVSVALLANGAFEIWFSYRDHEAALVGAEREEARAAAGKIEQFVSEIEGQIGWTTELPWSAATLDQRRFDALRLLRQVPAITELAQLDASGKEQLRVSRLEMDVVGAGTDYSHDPRFTAAMANKTWFGPVYFRRESEPYMTLAMAGARRDAGVSVAEVNLKFIWDVVSAIKVGQHGIAYVVDGDGRLIAHPDISLVLRNTSLARLPQVAAALQGTPQETVREAADPSGKPVLTAWAKIAPMGWYVFVELPVDEANAPLYASIERAGALLAGCLLLAFLAALFLARRMAVPIEALRAGAARIGGGDLGQRISIKTGDELESLADQFNDMAGRLAESYAGLERKVEERTHELSQSLDRQTATADILRVIASTPSDPTRALDTIAETAARMFGATNVAIRRRDGNLLRAVSAAGPLAAPHLDRLPDVPLNGTAFAGTCVRENRQVHIPDLQAEALPASAPARVGQAGGARTCAYTPLAKEGEAIGAMAIFRNEVRPFRPDELELMRGFADQAVIAIENARLLSELRESLDQQTATAEVLAVISSSPSDVDPVFDTILENAVRLCEADMGHAHSVEGETLRLIATRGASDEYNALIRQRGTFRPDERSAMLQTIRQKIPLLVEDMREHPNYIERLHGAVAMVETAGVRTLLQVPVVKDGTVVGLIVVYRREVRAFSEKHIALVENFAAQAVIAIENARLLTELREALDRQTATSEVLGVISSSPGALGPIFQTMLANAGRICDCVLGGLFLYEGASYRLVATLNVTPEFERIWQREASHPGPKTAFVRMARTKQVVSFDDLTTYEGYIEGDPLHVATVDLFGARSVLAVPMLKEGELLGAIVLFRREPRSVPEKQVALVTNFAAQAVIAIENARLLTELRESLARQTATADILRVIASTPGDPTRALDTIAETAARMFDASNVHFRRVEGKLLRLVSAAGPAASAMRNAIPDVPLEPGILGTDCVLENRQIMIEDLAATTIAAAPARLSRSMGIRTATYTPLAQQGHAIGLMVVYRTEVRPFRPDELELMRGFADQAVIAIENARLLTELRESLDRQTATSEVLGVISSSPGELGPAFETMLDNAVRICEAAQGGLWRIENGALYREAERNQPAVAAAFTQGFVPPPESAAGRMLAAKATFHIADLASLADSASKTAVAVGGIRTALWVPMMRDQAVVGAFSLGRDEVRPFSDTQIELVETFAAQAVIAIENARLLSELRESLDQQTATSEVLTVISRSAFELSPVLDTIVKTASRLCDAEFALIFTRRDELYHLAATNNASASFVQHAAEHPIPAVRGSLIGRTALECRTVHLPDCLADPEYTYLAYQESGNYRSILGVPLLRGKAPVGVIALFRAAIKPFTEKQIELVTTFAEQAVIAIENARLLSELRESLEQQTATADVLKIIGRSTFDLENVLDTLATSAGRLCESDMGFIFRRDGEVYRIGAAAGLTPEFVEDAHKYREFLDRHPLRPGRDTLTGRVAIEGRVVQIADVTADPEYNLPAFSLGRIRSQLGVPLLREGTPIGVLILGRQIVKPFTDKQIGLAITFADQAVIAIENARLLTELRESLDRQTATSNVLGVISGSQGDLEAVFQAIVANAARICETDFATLQLYDDDALRMAAVTHWTVEELRAFLARDGGSMPVSGKSLSGRVASTRATAHIEDYTKDEAYLARDPQTVRSVEVFGIRTVLGVPLLRGSAFLGLITVFRKEVKPFASKQIELVENFAAQAVIAIENARLLSELRESLDRQTATADILRVIASTPGDPTRALDTIAETAVRMFEASSVGIRRVEGNVLRHIASAGPYSTAVRAVFPDGPLDSSLPPMESVRENRHIVIEDTAKDTRRPPGMEASSGGSSVFMPLSREGHAIGVMIVNRAVVRPFTEKELELVRGFADQAVIAIENARLLTELRARTDELARSVGELRALGEVSQAVNSSLDLQTVLTTIVSNSVKLSATDAGAIYVYDEAADEFALRATFGMDEHLIAAIRGQHIRFGAAGIGEAAQSRLPVQVADMRAGERSAITDIIVAAGFRALLVMPLLRPGRVVGALVVRRRAPGEFAAATVDLLQTFAAQSVAAIENARLFGEIEEKSRELVIASQHKSQFLANMSHELRTPLNAILGYTELILDDIYGAAPARMRTVLERVQTNGKHLLGLINDVLDLSKIEAGQLTLQLAPYSVKDMLQGVFVAVEPLASNKKIALKLDLAKDMPPAKGDERRLSQVVLNLVGNAIKFTDEGEVTIAAHAADGSVLVQVSDTGPGIAAADQQKIFEEFQQADNSATRTKGGTGLGLAISRRIVALHGGRLWVESAVGKGSTFSVSLPVIVERQVGTA